MAEPPVKRRLQSILSPTADRRRESVHLRTLLLASFFCLAVVLGIVRPLATAPAAAVPAKVQETTIETQQKTRRPAQTAVATSPETDDDDLIELTEPVTGTITDTNGNPIADVRVVVKLMDFGDRTQSGFRLFTICEWQTHTDEVGRYTVDVAELGPQPARYCFVVPSAEKSGLVRTGNNWRTPVKEVAAGMEIRRIRMMKGRRITGQIRAASGQPVAALVKMVAKLESGNSLWTPGVEVDDSGRMQIDIPMDAKAQLVIYGKDHAPKVVPIPEDQSDLGVIQLAEGTIVSGSVVNAAGEMTPGVVVRLEGYDHSLPGLLVHWSRVAVTDSEGRFSLSPAEGECCLRALPHSRINDQYDTESIVGKVPPLIRPVELDLPGDRGNRDIILSETESISLSGTARWDDGTPTRDLEIEAGVRIGAKGRTTQLTSATTDENGHYKVLLPADSTVYLIATGAYRDNDRGEWYIARSSAPPPVESGSQLVWFDSLETDVVDIDWNLKIHRALPPIRRAQREATEAFTLLWAEDRAQEEPRPRLDLIGRYMKFEEEFRGEKQAVQSIANVLQETNSEWDIDPETSQIRNRLVDLLIAYYLGHENLADTFAGLYANALVPREDDLLRLASGRSPHPAVRAAALFRRAERARTELRNLSRLPQIRQQLAAWSDPDALRETQINPKTLQWRKQIMQRRLGALKAINPDELRRQAVRWLNTVEQEYGDLVRPRIPGQRTFGQDAKALRFAIEHVNVGQPAPPFQAVDVNSRPFRLFDNLGKVVVIEFYNVAIDPLPHRHFQSLANELKDRPFQLVTIVATDSREEFVETAKTMEDSGILIWEPYRGPFHSNWGVSSHSSTFIVSRSAKVGALQDQVPRLREWFQNWSKKNSVTKRCSCTGSCQTRTFAG